MVLTASIIPLQIDAFQHMQHFVQTMQQQAQHAIATEDQQHKQELHKLMARSAQGPGAPFSSRLKPKAFLRCRVPAGDTFQMKLMLWLKWQGISHLAALVLHSYPPYVQ